MQLDLDQLRDLLASLNQTDISELNLKGENFELMVRRGPEPPPESPLQALQPLPTAAAPMAAQQILPQQMMMPVAPVPQPPSIASPAATGIAPSHQDPSTPPQRLSDWVEIKSPMVGTFYRAPAPGEADFVAVGDKIKAGQTVCIIEAMKLMNELESEVTGDVVEILVDNGQPVEFDQPLMRVKPTP